MEGTERACRLLSGMIQDMLYNLDQLPDMPEGNRVRELLLEMEQIAKEMLG